MSQLVPFTLSMLLFLLLVSPAGAQAPVEGKITEIKKDEDTPTGSLKIIDNTGTITTYTVNEATRFQLLRGSVIHKSSFVMEHVGENVKIFLDKKDPLLATRVQILLPAVVPGNPTLHAVHGTVTEVTSKGITILLPHDKPQAPVVGVVTDVKFNQDNETGTMTLKVQDKEETYTINIWTVFVKVDGKTHQRASFLSEFQKETVVVYLRPGASRVASRVDIVVGGPAVADQHALYHHRNHLVSYQLQPTSEYELVRDKKHTPATLKNVVVGEHVSILPTGVHAHIASQVHIHLPHALHGEVVSLSATFLKIKVHHPATKEKPAEDTMVNIPLDGSTTYETIDKKVSMKATASAVKSGWKVVVYQAGPPPNVAERVEILLTPIRASKIRGIVVSVGMGALTVRVKHPAKEGKPANETNEVFQLGPMTVIETITGSTHSPATVIALIPGSEVTIHAQGRPGSPGEVDKIEIRTQKTKKSGPK